MDHEQTTAQEEPGHEEGVLHHFIDDRSGKVLSTRRTKEARPKEIKTLEEELAR